MILRSGVPVALLVLLGQGCSHTSPYAAVPWSAEERVAEERADRVLLFGDGGAPFIEEALPDEKLYEGDAALTALHAWASRIPGRTTIVFLGDNIYEDGLPEEAGSGYEESRRRLQAQTSVVEASGARGLFIPGNHDWADGRRGGWDAVLRQEKYVDSALGAGSFLPRGGHPGPEHVDMDLVRIVALDTQWWLHPRDDRPMALKAEDGEAPGSPKEAEVLEQRRIIGKLRGCLDGNGREVIVAGHHPVATHGPHGGFFDWRYHLFPFTEMQLPVMGRIPLPVIGSIYPLGRWYLLKRNQDLSGSRYKVLVEALTEALSGKDRPLIYAAGHEHSLQVLRGGEAADYLLVSGSGSKTSNVSHGVRTLFAHEHSGFMAVDFLEDGGVLLRVIEPTEQEPAGEVVFTKWLRRAGQASLQAPSLGVKTASSTP